MLNRITSVKYNDLKSLQGPVGWGCRIDRLHLCRGVRLPHPNEYPKYDTKQSDAEAQVMWELSGMQSTP